MKTRTTVLLTTTMIAFFAYVLSYSFLSVQGEYVPACWGLGWVKWYNWAPRGFASGPKGLKQNRVVQSIFLPLWWVDMKLVHTSDKSEGGYYPVNRILDNELQKWYNERHRIFKKMEQSRFEGEPEILLDIEHMKAEQNSQPEAGQ